MSGCLVPVRRPRWRVRAAAAGLVWLVCGVAVVFAVGVLSLFFTAGNSKHNPNLDDNGTAV